MCAGFIWITESENISLPFELVYLSVDISLSIEIFYVCKASIHCVLRFKFTETETAESAFCLLSLFYKSTFCCYWEDTQMNDLLYSYIYDQK